MRERHGIIRHLQQLPYTHRELLSTRALTGQAIALACIIALFAFIGPFGTYDSMGLLGRVGYWTVAMGANWLVCASVMGLALHIVDAGSRRRLLLTTGATALLAAVPGTGVVFTAEVLFRPDYTDETSLPAIYLSVAVLMLVIGYVVVTVRVRQRGDSEEDAAAASDNGASDPAARFLDRLPPELGRDLIYLKMADHYVEAFTAAGSTLVLMRFADAIAELKGTNGLQVHRSYWVAREHVAGTVRHNGRRTLRLTGGHEVPVSRSYLADARSAGLV